jgi:peptide/nickel transport system ATP-binding protein
VQIPSPEKRLAQYPHEFSGGMRQRIVIAIALFTDPEIIIADEPTTALDVTIQAEIMDLLQQLCESEHTGLILITHDLGVVSQVTETIAVMYAGKIVESGPRIGCHNAPAPLYPGIDQGAARQPAAGSQTEPDSGNDANLDRHPPRLRLQSPLHLVRAICRKSRNRPLSPLTGTPARWPATWFNPMPARQPMTTLESNPNIPRDEKTACWPWIRWSNTSISPAACWTRLRFRKRAANPAAYHGQGGQQRQFHHRPRRNLQCGGRKRMRQVHPGTHHLGIYPPNSGRILYRGERIDNKNAQQMLPFRRKMQMIFQDPYASLNPRKTVMQTLEEPVVFHNPSISSNQVKARVAEVMSQVGVDPKWAGRYPHEFSGGQRQRISIARALMVDPEFIVADEPVSALDVSIQAQILNLLMDAQAQRGLTYMFITHDLSVVEHISTRVAVMYLGTLCELSPAKPCSKPPPPLHPGAAFGHSQAGPQKKRPRQTQRRSAHPHPPAQRMRLSRPLHSCRPALRRRGSGIRTVENGVIVACHGVEEGRL